MENKLKSVLSGMGFYVCLAVCLVIAAVSGYFLLFAGDDAPEEEEVSVSAPANDVYVPAATEPEEEVPVQAGADEEVLSPVEVETIPAMPEVTIDPTPVQIEAPQLVVSPLKGEVLMAYSVDQLIYSPTMADWRTHDGVDISAKPGDTVLAASAGTVASVEDDPLMGTTVTIEHQGGYTTTYANLQGTPTVLPGDLVNAGQIIGAVGTTAAAESSQSPHLHFAVTKNGEAVDPDTFLNG